jgi:hypothetical protein
MKFITLFVKRHPLVTFFALSFMLTWGFLPVESVRFFPAGVCFAALIVASMGHGLAGLRELGTRMLRWRVGWRMHLLEAGIWCAVALGLIVFGRRRWFARKGGAPTVLPEALMNEAEPAIAIR